MAPRHSFHALGVISLFAAAAFAHSDGPDPRFTAAPGDAPQACTSCHGGTINSGPGSVKIVLPNGPSYSPGVKQHITVQVADPDQIRWGFQLTARLNSNLANGQAGELSSTDDFTQVICENVSPKPCPDNQPVQFIEHTATGTRTGTSNGVGFEFDWTPPATDAGKITFYVAANAANGNGESTGDRIYGTSQEINSPTSANDPPPPPPATQVTKYLRHYLVSDIPGLADQTDPNLMNPWGIALGANSAFWISNNRTGTATLYNATGQQIPADNPLVVKVPIPPGSSATGSPTGQVSNSTPVFEVQPGKPALFIFASEDGTISGWNPGVDNSNAILMVDNSASGAVYKGLTIGSSSSGPVLYAANFRGGTVDVFDQNFQPLTVSGGFVDSNLPAGFAPFNVQTMGQDVYVTYAKQDSTKRNVFSGLGDGFLNVFDGDGNLRKRLISNGALNSPWGLTLAPESFGDYSKKLLVGNFGNGRINAFDLSSGQLLGTIQDSTGAPIFIEGLRALQLDTSKTGADANTLYFTAGISNGDKIEDHGVFGTIQVAPKN